MLLELFIGLGVDLLGEVDYRLEVDVGLLILGILLLQLVRQVTYIQQSLRRTVSGFLVAPEGSSASSTSSFFTFAGPPPNIEKTLSLTAAAADETKRKQGLARKIPYPCLATLWKITAR